MDWLRNNWIIGIVTSVIGGLIVAEFLYDDMLAITSSEQSTIDAKGDVGSVESTMTNTPRSVVEADADNWTEDIGAAVDERQCDTLVNEVRTIPNSSNLDAAVSEVVSELIDESRNVTYAEMAANLDCAGRLAQISHYSSNKDRVLARVIEENIQVGRCRAARELANHLHYSSNQSEQKAKVARECLGRD